MHDSEVGVALASRHRLDVLEIDCLADPVPIRISRALLLDEEKWDSPETHDTDGRSVNPRSVDRSRHQDGLPLDRDPHTSTLRPREREPVQLFRLGVKEVVELDLDESERSIRRDRVLVKDVHANDGGVALGDEELG